MLNPLQNFFQSGTKGGKSYLTFEWTNQHGSGRNDDTNPHKLNNDIVLQYMCQPAHDKLNVASVRNGINTNTPNFKASNNKQESLVGYRQRKAGNVDVNRGMHESWEWYDKCRRRERNQGREFVVLRASKIGRRVSTSVFSFFYRHYS